MFDNASLRKLINEHGQSLTIRTYTIGSFNEDTLTQARTSADQTVKGYFYEFTPSMIDGSTVLVGDRRLVLDSKTTGGAAVTEPKPDDQVIGNGDTVNVVKTSKIISNNTLMCYILQVRE